MHFAQTCLVLLLSISLACTEGPSENNVFVEFSQNVPPDNGLEIIENMKKTLQAASQFLYNATELLFVKVTFEIPESWDTSGWNMDIEDVYLHSFSSDSQADILIDNTNDTVFGKFPLAHQYGSCGTPGHKIIVPTAFFDEANEFPKDISLAREWLKYRYGVFDENGYVGDPLYPLYYDIPGTDEVHFTDCTNAKITYNFKNQEGEECPSDKMFHKLTSGDCSFIMNDEGLENVTSSFMYFHANIINMTHICGMDEYHSHNSRSRNKQNLLCYGKSIWDTISNKTKEVKKEAYVDTEFVFLKRAKPRVVVAWENTEKMDSTEKVEKQGKIILNAITKLMIDLPDGSMFSAFPFTKDVQNKDYKLENLDEMKTRKTIASDIKSDFAATEDGDYKGAVEKAYAILKNPDEPLGSIIIITGTQDEFIVILLKADSDCKEIADIPNETDKLTSDSHCLEVVRISRSSEIEVIYEKLVEAVERISLSKMHDKVTETIKIERLSQNTSLTVEVDDFTDKVTFWIFTDKQSENFELKLNGEIKTETEDVTYGNVLQLSYSPTQAGNIEIYYKYKAEPMLIEVQKTSKAEEYFTGEIIVQDTTDPEDTHQMPVIIYAIVRFGSYPVQNAKVVAIIQRPKESEIELELNDNGRGDPDITRNDGIYSRYFTNFSHEGEYTVTVTISNNNEDTTYGKDENAGYKSCCGSTINGKTPTINKFEKVFKKTFIAKSGRPEDGYKPSRITDLRVHLVSEDGIILNFTAPGGEADSGRVQSYEIKSFTLPEVAMNNFDSGTEIFKNTSLKERDETEEFKISNEVFESNGLYYIAMKAKNSNKTSDISNIVQAYIRIPDVTDAPDKETGNKNTKAGRTDPKTIGLIVGLIVGLVLLCIIIYVVIYFVIVKPKRRKQQKENPIYDSTQKTEGSSVHSINFVSADTLIKHHNEKMKAKRENKESPIFKEEDFEDKNPQPTNESRARSNDQKQENSSKNPRNGQPFPPKSPKRTTPV